MVWRPRRREVAKHMRALAELPFLTYQGRRLNGNGSLWRSFHFRVNGTDWVVVLHDQGKPKAPWVVFVERAEGVISGGRFADYPRFLRQIPESLRMQVEVHASLLSRPPRRSEGLV